MGVADALRFTDPRRDGFQLHVARILGEVPVVLTFIQPGIRTLLALKVTFAGTVTFAFIWMVDLYTAAPEIAKELKAEVSTMSMTETVIVS